MFPVAWGDGHTHEQHPLVCTMDFGDGRVIRRTTFSLIERNVIGQLVKTIPLPASHLEMTGFTEVEQAEFRELSNSNDIVGMDAFVERVGATLGSP